MRLPAVRAWYAFLFSSAPFKNPGTIHQPRHSRLPGISEDNSVKTRQILFERKTTATTAYIAMTGRTCCGRKQQAPQYGRQAKIALSPSPLCSDEPTVCPPTPNFPAEPAIFRRALNIPPSPHSSAEPSLCRGARIVLPSPSCSAEPTLPRRAPPTFYRAQMLTDTGGALLTSAGASNEPPLATASSLKRRGSARGSTSTGTVNDEMYVSGSLRAPSP